MGSDGRTREGDGGRRAPATETRSLMERSRRGGAKGDGPRRHSAERFQNEDQRDTPTAPTSPDTPFPHQYLPQPGNTCAPTARLCGGAAALPRLLGQLPARVPPMLARPPRAPPPPPTPSRRGAIGASKANRVRAENPLRCRERRRGVTGRASRACPAGALCEGPREGGPRGAPPPRSRWLGDRLPSPRGRWSVVDPRSHLWLANGGVGRPKKGWATSKDGRSGQQ